eukprot:TRINITY_DN82863_c0_g1_i1.p1 TRINITY_DN82863_c0_g1~~TRINITY_DN82863_c0_g1_i1.p1  ORF type:complete len:334 (+),score=67.88 TRINITY_DN82863_c0_g1_i1:16-1017(+)
MPGKFLPPQSRKKRQREPEPPSEPEDSGDEEFDDVEEGDSHGDRTETASLQELTFDVNEVQPSDLFSLMDLLDRHFPFDVHPDNMEVLAGQVQHAKFASVAKVADDDDQADLVFGATAMIPLKSEKTGALIDAFAPVARALSEADPNNYFAEAFAAAPPVAWLLTERLPSLPLELGIAMLEDIFREYREATQKRATKRAEYFFALVRVDNRPVEDDDAGKEDAPRQKRKRGAAVKPEPVVDKLTPETLEDRHFAKPEEYFFWVHRVVDAPFVLLQHVVKRGDIAAEPPVGKAPEVFSIPILIHRSRINRLLADLKNLDAYYQQAETLQHYEDD